LLVEEANVYLSLKIRNNKRKNPFAVILPSHGRWLGHDWIDKGKFKPQNSFQNIKCFYKHLSKNKTQNTYEKITINF
jgi:hypothetical protein